MYDYSNNRRCKVFINETNPETDGKSAASYRKVFQM